MVLYMLTPRMQGELMLPYSTGKIHSGLLHNAFFPVRLKSGETTRDILYCEGISAPNDTLHVFVCHFPSMRGGEAKSEWKRVKAASVVRQKVDSIQDLHPRAMILIFGRFERAGEYTRRKRR